MSEPPAQKHDLEPLARSAMDRREGLVTFIRRIEENRALAIAQKMPAVSLACDRLLAELTGYLKGESASASVTIIIGGDDARLL